MTHSIEDLLAQGIFLSRNLLIQAFSAKKSNEPPSLSIGKATQYPPLLAGWILSGSPSRLSENTSISPAFSPVT